MPSQALVRGGALRRAVIGAATLLLAGAAINQSAFAHSRGDEGTKGQSPHSAVQPGHAQDPPGRRGHGHPSANALSHGRRDEAGRSGTKHHAVAVNVSPQPAATPRHSVTNHSSQSGVPPQNGHHKTTICHATGSATNPYVEISIPPPAVQAHSRHQDGRDIIPAPEGGCPGAAAQSTTAEQPAGTTETPSTAASQTAATVVASVPVATPSKPTASGEHGVLGVEASGGRGTAPASLTAARPAASRDAGGGLPFTGFEAALAAALGIALVAGGAGVRRATRA